MNKLADTVPDGYALISIDALKAWGKYDEVRNACQFPAEQAEQEPVARVPAHPEQGLEWLKPPPVWGTLLYVAHVEPVKQEPVAIDWDTIHQVLCEVWGRDSSADEGLEAIQGLIYAAHVRTKDLADSEIATLIQRHTIDGVVMPFALCEAAIAADREKNK